MSRFAFRLPLSVITERGPGGEVNARTLSGFTISSPRLTTIRHFRIMHAALERKKCIRMLAADMSDRFGKFNDNVNSVNGTQKRKITPSASVDPRIEVNPPPPPDEAYWSALLNEGEASAPGASYAGETWSDSEISFDVSHNAPTGLETQTWEAAQHIFDSDETVDLPVVGANRGGLLVEWDALRGFVPASQLVDFPAITDPTARKQQLIDRIGSTLTLRVIELDHAQNRLILSERAAQVEPGTRATVLDTLRRGDVLQGHVTNLCDFGAFVDLGGLEGLIHISELSWGRVGHPRDLLNRGDDIAVYVMEIHRDQGRVALSIKRLQPDPWETVEQRYQIGQIIEGVITNIVDFGAFACVEEGLEGLIHVSELAEGHFLHPRNVVQEGERVRARILNIDGHARRLGLSLREYSPEAASLAEHSAGAETT